MKTIKELEAEMELVMKDTSKNFLVGKRDALKDIKKLIEEFEPNVDEGGRRLLADIKARIEGK